MEALDPTICYRALQTRDPRFDGRLFVGVTSTGIYCRPICPARTSRFENCRFFVSAAAAAEAGFRPCLRCRPETAPELGAWRGTGNTVSRALALIADGALDGDGSSVDALAGRLGIGERQLRRLFRQHLGASPVSVAQTRRVHFAKQLIHDTDLAMTEVALAAGFGSVRRFNETFQALYGRPPSSLRRRPLAAGGDGVELLLRYRAPYDWSDMLAALTADMVEGVTAVRDGIWHRALRLEGHVGWASVAHAPEKQSLRVHIRFPAVAALPGLIARIRRQFDLAADGGAIGAQLADDPILAPLVAARPGLRAPGLWDGWEGALSALFNTDRQGLADLVRHHGTTLPPGLPVSHAFPDAGQLLAEPSRLSPALRRLAEAVQADPALFQPAEQPEELARRLTEQAGLPPPTAFLLAGRLTHPSDAVPAGSAAPDHWRPWRAYAHRHFST